MNPLLQQVIGLADSVHKANRTETMSSVDVINRLTMNERLQHNMNRMDAQVDAHMRKQHGECYESPDLPEMAEHRINSPTINIGVEAARTLLSAGSDTQSSTAGEGETIQNDNTSSAQPTATAATKQPTNPSTSSRTGDWLRTAALVGATSIGTGAVVSYMSGDHDTDTRNTYEIQAVPFDPTVDPNI